jgi:hypothetical protein
MTSRSPSTQGRRIGFAAVALVLVAPVCGLAANAGNGPKAQIFAKFDTNKNSKIDGDEIAVVRAAFAADAKGQFARYDVNHDGKLDDSEIAEIKPPGAGGRKGDKGGTKESGKKNSADGSNASGEKSSAR